ncbi:MAG: hypothetical protein D6780_04395 [Candidatus Dadabacteria bacterium]|nr:MAG: hypothetical protein D6780_04395 [Candidatus Dadabacteria bacterium]
MASRQFRNVVSGLAIAASALGVKRAGAQSESEVASTQPIVSLKGVGASMPQVDVKVEGFLLAKELKEYADRGGVLRVGSRGDLVYKLQRVLVLMGEEIKVDGIFGSRTKGALVNFQGSAGLKRDGIFGVKTAEKLFEKFSGEGREELSTQQVEAVSAGLAEKLLEKHCVRGISSGGQCKSYSRFNYPLSEWERKVGVRSRCAGDASKGVQIYCMKLALEKFRGLPLEHRAVLLALIEHESGWNPGAAAKASSAAGLIQLVRGTEEGLGLSEGEAFNPEKALDALLKLYEEYRRNPYLTRCKDGESFCIAFYALHHDGPSLRSGGERIARERVLPKFKEWLTTLKELEKIEAKKGRR